MRKIFIASPYFSPQDRERIHRGVDAILDGALSMGPNVKAFEEEFAKMMGVKHAIAVNSCTSALEISLLALGMTVGSEVIVPVETFIATGMAIHLTGGVPIFADIEESTFCLDLEDVKRRINPKTKGIIIVHMGGLITPKIYELKKFCEENKLFLIEDAAHSPGARFNGQYAGSIGDVGCFSFYPSKVMTSGEGGMLTTNSDQVAAFARNMQHRGRDMTDEDEIYILPGRNVRMSELNALIGRVQLSHLEEFLTTRRKIAEIYRDELQNDMRGQLIVASQHENSSYWKVPFILPSAKICEAVTAFMHANGVMVDSAYRPPLHLQPVFKRLYGIKEGHLPRSENLIARHICLPCHPQMSQEDAKHVTSTLKEALSSCEGKE